MEQKIAKAARAIHSVAEAEAAPAATASAAAAVTATPALAPERAPAAAPAPQREAAAFSPTAALSAERQSAPVLPKAKLQVLSGTFAGRELELNKALTTLGSPSIQVAAITRRAEGYYIVHVEGGKQNKFPLVNGQDIGAQVSKLSDNDVIELAGVKMGFFLS